MPTKMKRNPKVKRIKEDARDVAIIRRESRKPTYSLRAFLRQLGYEISDQQSR